MAYRAKKQRGTKRNATDLLAATDHQDINNPRPAKRQCTSNDRYEATLQALLTMSLSEVNALPERLRNQALALRAERNVSNPPDNRNKNSSNHRTNNNNDYSIAPNPKHVMHHDTLMELSSDEESDEEDDEDSDVPQNRPSNTNHHRTIPSNPPQTHHDTRVRNPSYNPSWNDNTPHSNYNPAFNHNPLPRSIPLQAPPAIPVSSQSFTHRMDNRRSSVISQPRSQPPPMSHPSQTPLDSSDIRVPPQRYINVQDLLGKKQNPSAGKCSCFGGSVRIIVSVLCMVPFFMAIPFSRSYGTNYCDTNSRVIRAYGNYNCVECPLNAKMCIKGQAWCEDTSYWVDPAVNECVKREYLSQVMRGYREVGKSAVQWIKQGGNGMLRYYDSEIAKWQSVKEWKTWFETLKQLSFVEFCKQYEMEVMVAFFVFTWYLPMFRCLIIFLWTRMILPTVSGGDDPFIKIYLKLLSYFAPILFSYDIWNKIATLFAEKSG